MKALVSFPGIATERLPRKSFVTAPSSSRIPRDPHPARPEVKESTLSDFHPLSSIPYVGGEHSQQQADELATPTLDRHRARLQESFACDLLRLEPQSVLDVGFGRAVLLQSLTDKGVEACGVDRSLRRVESARTQGFEAFQAEASALPFQDRQYDWVVVRHVLHHLEDPRDAVAEAWRVARSGVVLAEPYTDPSIQSQITMARLDRFLNERMARRGHVHQPYLSAGALLDLAPEAPSRVELRSYGALQVIPKEEVEAMARRALGTQEERVEESDRLAGFLREAAQGLVSANGSMTVFFFR